MELRKAPQQWKLYVITDQQLSRGRSHVEIAGAAISGGADVIQLRDKSANSLKLYQTASQLRKLTGDAGIPFIVNDRLDIALAAGADGLHLGQDDLPAPVARELLGPHKILGVSASSIQEALQAEGDGADYLGVGPVFEARTTKADAGEPRGLQLIRDIREKCSVPIVAIGGINHENISEVIRAGAQCAAVISAIVSANNIARASQQLKEIIEETLAKLQ